jgi:hypothetical protein
MPRRTSIGLSTDTHTRSLGILGHDEVPVGSGDDGGGDGGGPPICGTCDDYWITTYMELNGNIIDAQMADPGNDFYPIEVMNTLGAFDSFDFGVALDISEDVGTDPHWKLGNGSGYQHYSGTVEAGTIYLVEINMSYDFGSQVANPSVSINGSDLGFPQGYDLGYDIGSNADKYAFFGVDIPDGNDDDVVSFHGMKIGTTRGGDDIWDGSSLADTLPGPFDGTYGTDASTSLSASGGVLEAVGNWTVHPHGNCYAYAVICV